jgi:hypothetical protein
MLGHLLNIYLYYDLNPIVNPFPPNITPIVPIDKGGVHKGIDHSEWVRDDWEIKYKHQ